jgi:hypothetical protein
MDCPFCRTANANDALVCTGCTRDIGVPVSLLNERDNLRSKRQLLLTELEKARSQLAQLNAPGKAG